MIYFYVEFLLLNDIPFNVIALNAGMYMYRAVFATLAPSLPLLEPSKYKTMKRIQHAHA